MTPDKTSCQCANFIYVFCKFVKTLHKKYAFTRFKKHC